MDKRTRIIREWRESTQEAIVALIDWRDRLAEWEEVISGRDIEASCTPFDYAFNELHRAGLGEWADANPAGGGLDVLAAAVKGEELPEPERDLVKAIFGG